MKNYDAYKVFASSKDAHNYGKSLGCKLRPAYWFPTAPGNSYHVAKQETGHFVCFIRLKESEVNNDE
jgi:hypothetical protein